MTEEYGPKHIGDEVQAQLDRLQGSEPTAELIGTEELDREAASIVFDPTYETPFPRDPVVIDGVEKKIHGTSSFTRVFGLMDYFLSGGQADPNDILQLSYKGSVQERKYDQIFPSLQAQYPMLYKKIKQIYDEVEARRQANKGVEKFSEMSQKDFGTEEEIAQRDYYRSVAYQAAAQIARSIDPEYPLSNLY
jgi:hypothetical protein